MDTTCRIMCSANRGVSLTVVMVTGRSITMHARFRGELSSRPVTQNQTPNTETAESASMMARAARCQRCESSKAVMSIPCEAQPRKAPAYTSEIHT